MENINQLVELSATLAETTLAISVVTFIAEKRHRGLQHILLIFGTSLFMTFCITLLNHWATFSFVTITFSLLYAAFATKLTAKGPLLLRLTSSVLVFLVIVNVDYIVSFGLGLLLDPSKTAFHTFHQAMTPGLLRTSFLATSKTLSAVVLLLLRPIISILRSFSRQLLILLLVVSSIMHLISSFLLTMIITESIGAMQTAIMLSWIFIILSMGLVFTMLVAFIKQQNAQQEINNMDLLHTMMTQNYQRLHEGQQEMAKRAHDFNRHLSILSELAHTNSPGLVSYIKNLQERPSDLSCLCKSGNDVIDAIVNCKSTEARRLDIPFQFNISFQTPLAVSPIDLCAILANQLDNAFEASLKSLNPQQRQVKLSIYQRNQLLFFSVTNSVQEDPFRGNKTLRTTKKNQELHGFGLHRIQETAHKYNGACEASCKNHEFCSSVFISLPLDTKNNTTGTE